jgi:hypothetical protein
LPLASSLLCHHLDLFWSAVAYELRCSAIHPSIPQRGIEGPPLSSQLNHSVTKRARRGLPRLPQLAMNASIRKVAASRGGPPHLDDLRDPLAVQSVEKLQQVSCRRPIFGRRDLLFVCMQGKNRIPLSHPSNRNENSRGFPKLSNFALKSNPES